MSVPPPPSPDAASSAASGAAAVRAARPSDVDAIADIQCAVLRQRHAEVLGPRLVAALDPTVVAAQWRAALAGPPTARHRLLVATQDSLVVGFAASGPASGDADDASQATAPAAGAAVTELLLIAVAELHRRHGHGSRLLQAVADLSVAEAAPGIEAWVPAGDELLRRFLQGAGFAPDGSFRDGARPDGPERLRQVRLVAALAEPPGDAPAEAAGPGAR